MIHGMYLSYIIMSLHIKEGAFFARDRAAVNCSSEAGTCLTSQDDRKVHEGIVGS